VTELRRLNADLTALALYDPLTELANRRLLGELMEAALARSERRSTPIAVLFIDLDGFKQINDLHGHDTGDAVLRATANRLCAIARTADIVARVGGDEFVVVEESDGAGDDDLPARLERALALPIEITPTLTVTCPASIGRADTIACGYDAIALLTAADAAMYEVKRARHPSAA
jgi:diguanylate cyclase (GGDEF)-like protein